MTFHIFFLLLTTFEIKIFIFLFDFSNLFLCHFPSFFASAKLRVFLYQKHMDEILGYGKIRVEWRVEKTPTKNSPAYSGLLLVSS